MPDPRQIVLNAFQEWSAGNGSITSIFGTDMKWEIAGRSVVSGTYDSARAFIDGVLRPFGLRFSSADPFRPVRIRDVIAEGDRVVITWDGSGTTTAGTSYKNTYAWCLTIANGEVTDALAFFDSIAFNQLWDIPPVDDSAASPSSARSGAPL